LNVAGKIILDYVENMLRHKGEITVKVPTDGQRKLLGIKNEALLSNTHTIRLEDGRARNTCRLIT
jgi:hypothetical protein